MQEQELEQEWVALEAWVEQVLIPSQEWAAWVACRCSLVWQQAVVHPVWGAWVVPTWTLRWLTK